MLEQSELTEKVVSAAIEVHRHLGPGLMESVYEECFCHELAATGVSFTRQVALPIQYKSLRLDGGLRLDVVVEGLVVVELKSVEKVLPVHEAQLLSYLKLGNYPVGLLINFNVALLKHGITRRALTLPPIGTTTNTPISESLRFSAPPR
jgi:GxxExxY protein